MMLLFRLLGSDLTKFGQKRPVPPSPLDQRMAGGGLEGGGEAEPAVAHGRAVVAAVEAGEKALQSARARICGLLDVLDSLARQMRESFSTLWMAHRRRIIGISAGIGFFLFTVIVGGIIYDGMNARPIWADNCPPSDRIRGTCPVEEASPMPQDTVPLNKEEWDFPPHDPFWDFPEKAPLDDRPPEGRVWPLQASL